MLCEYDDSTLQKLPCYKSLTNLIPVRKAMLRLLAACHYMQDKRADIFQHLYKALNSSLEMQEVGYQCIKDIISKYDIDQDIVSDLYSFYFRLQNIKFNTVSNKNCSKCKNFSIHVFFCPYSRTAVSPGF